MRVEILGPLVLRNGQGQALPSLTGRSAVLLARLALAPGRTVTADLLLAEVWDGDPPGGGTETLARLVSRARSLLRGYGAGDLGPRAVPGGYVLDAAPEEVDLHRFETWAERGRRQLADHNPAEADETLSRTLELWCGEPLAGINTRFAEHTRHRLAELKLTATEDLLEARSRLGQAAALLPELRGLCEHNPLRERPHGLLMRALRADGRDAEALAVYDRLRNALAVELGADPAPWLRELHTDLLRSADPVPATGSPTASGNRIAPYLTRFHGRGDELKALSGLLGEHRLVTLFGPGGVGKTRIAVELLSSGTVSGGDLRRASFVELAPLWEEQGIVDAVADAVGVGGSSLLEGPNGRGRLSQLASVLSDGPGLLVLDNCEHLLDGVAETVLELLGRCPELRVLTTSREPLAADGEAVLRVDPLEVTESRDSVAVRMFTERAALAAPGTEPCPEDLPVVAQICRRLDGLPLAIELAAARVRSMTVREIADRLDERFALLSAVRRTVPQRHRTLRAVLDWSWDLLPEPEQRVARRLSVLPGGATAEGAARVCALDDLPAAEMPFLLASLVDRSLLRPTASRGGPTRYRLMETTLAYVRERLRDAGEEERAWATATAHLTERAESAGHDLLGADQGRALRLFDDEHDNLAGLLTHVTEAGDHAAAARLASALVWYWVMRGRFEEGARRLDGIDLSATDTSTRTVLLAARSMLPALTGQDRSGEAAEIVRLVDDDRIMAAFPPVVVIGAKQAESLGDHDGLAAIAERASAHPHPWVRSAGLCYLGSLAEATGDPDTAEARAGEAVTAAQDVGDQWMVAMMTPALAQLRSQRGHNEQAVRDIEQALELIDPEGPAGDLLPGTLIALGYERLRCGDRAGAERTLASALNAESGLRLEYRILSLCRMCDVALDNGDAVRARALLTEARSLLDRAWMDVLYLCMELHMSEGAVWLAEGDDVQAGVALREAWELIEGVGMAFLNAGVAELAADLLLQRGRPEEAAHALAAATRLRGRPDLGSPRVRRLRHELRGVPADPGPEWRFEG